MRKRTIAFVAVAFGMAAYAAPPANQTTAAAQTKPAAPTAPPAGGGLAGNAEQQAKQAALEKATPKLTVSEEVLRLSIPGQTIGEAVGVAKNAAGHLFVFSRTGKTAQVKGSAASMLFEFDPSLKIREGVGPEQLRRRLRPHRARRQGTERVDGRRGLEHGGEVPSRRQRGDGARPEGRAARLAREVRRGGRPPRRYPPARNGVFNRPTDVTWDTQGNIFVSDGYNNSRVAKFTKDGTWVKAIGERGAAPNQFNTPHGITSDDKGNIYVADRGNRRVQVYDPDLNPVRIIEGMGAPWTLCTTPGPTQYLMSGDGNGKLYKMSLDGKLLGWAQTSLGHGQSGCLIHELHCESETVLYKGDCSTWTVEKLTIAK